MKALGLLLGLAVGIIIWYFGAAIIGESNLEFAPRNMLTSFWVLIIGPVIGFLAGRRIYNYFKVMQRDQESARWHEEHKIAQQIEREQKEREKIKNSINYTDEVIISKGNIITEKRIKDIDYLKPIDAYANLTRMQRRVICSVDYIQIIQEIGKKHQLSNNVLNLLKSSVYYTLIGIVESGMLHEKLIEELNIPSEKTNQIIKEICEKIFHPIIEEYKALKSLEEYGRKIRLDNQG